MAEFYTRYSTAIRLAPVYTTSRLLVLGFGTCTVVVLRHLSSHASSGPGTAVAVVLLLLYCLGFPCLIAAIVVFYRPAPPASSKTMSPHSVSGLLDSITRSSTVSPPDSPASGALDTPSSSPPGARRVSAYFSPGLPPPPQAKASMAPIRMQTFATLGKRGLTDFQVRLHKCVAVRPQRAWRRSRCLVSSFKITRYRAPSCVFVHCPVSRLVCGTQNGSCSAGEARIQELLNLRVCW